MWERHRGMNEYAALRERYARFGQAQVFRFWDRLDPNEKKHLIEQAKEIDLEEIGRLTSGLASPAIGGEGGMAEIEPAPSIAHPESGGDLEAWSRARVLGEEALRDSKVAAFTVAGGQGTRFGFDGPKGTYRISPVKGKPLFAIFAEKIRQAQEYYGAKIPWFIMTSRENHNETTEFFEQHGNFGLSGEEVFLFVQGQMPSVSFEGRILLESVGRIAMNPDGHGGSLRALVRSGAVDRMRQQGIEVISYFQVDNPLVNVADPAFIGFHIEHGSELSSKMVTKSDPEENVGLFCLRDGRLSVIEYSDLPENVAAIRDAKGRLSHRAGSVAIHLLSREFVEKVGGGSEAEIRLPFHQARKKVSVIDEDGRKIASTGPNAVKFEMFIFDAISFASNPIVVETLRSEEFSPVKNAEGPDSPETCRAQQLRQWARWLRRAGINLPCDSTGLPSICFEISPLFAATQESFVEKWQVMQGKPVIWEGTYLE